MSSFSQKQEYSGIVKVVRIPSPKNSTANLAGNAGIQTILNNSSRKYIYELVHMHAYVSNDATVASRSLEVYVTDECGQGRSVMQTDTIPASGARDISYSKTFGTYNYYGYRIMCPLPVTHLEPFEVLKANYLNGVAGDTWNMKVWYIPVPVNRGA